MIAQRLAALLFASSLANLATAAAPAPAASVQELEKGLTYARIADLGRDAAQLEAALAQPAIILDLRDATATQAEAKALAGRLVQMPPKPADHRLILINPSTDAGILRVVEIPEPRQLTIGPRASGFQADIAVPTSADDDQRAFAAFANGAPLNKLDDSNPAKKRNDEAALAKNRAAAVAEAEADEEGSAAAPTPTPPEKAETRVHDLVLERAVQLHHALLVITPQSIAP